MNQSTERRNKHILRLHWKLFFPLVGMLWVIIGIAIGYFIIHEKQRLKENLGNRLLNVNNTVIAAYDRGVDLQETVDFIKLFTDNTTLAPLRITVYDGNGVMIADNREKTISLSDVYGDSVKNLSDFAEGNGAVVHDMVYDRDKSMICSKVSGDGVVHSFAALPYDAGVLDFLGVDPMVWLVVIGFGVVSSVMAYLGVRAVCRNVYSLRDYAQAIASDCLPESVDPMNFSKDELGDVSRNLLTLYRHKIHAQQEKLHHERQIGLNISHELNTPIGIIKGYIDTVLDDGDMPKEVKRRFLIRAKQNVDRLASLVGDVVMVMRLQDGGDGLSLSPVNFHQMVARVAEDVELGRIAGKMTFEYDIPSDCVVTGHESLLTNALLNLIYNAAQHSGGTRIVLKWKGTQNGRHLFEFADNGIGVDDEHLERLFDLFYRVDSGRSRKNGGAGLGLPLVLRIINSMGGDISVENAKGGGLKYNFSLPMNLPTR